MSDDRFFGELASATDAGEHDQDRAPARLKSRIYSALVAEQAKNGPLLSLTDSLAAGHRLCVFERALTTVSTGGKVASMNPCRVCHARVLGERFESPPTYWPHCPYVEFRRS